MDTTSNPNWPLNENHYQALNGALQTCALLDDLLGKCQAAGLNVDPKVKENRQRTQLASGIKSAFFPDRP